MTGIEPLAVTEAIASAVNVALPAINASNPRAKRKCPKCGGSGHYYDPPEQVQREQIAAGTRQFTVGRVCGCIKG